MLDKFYLRGRIGPILPTSVSLLYIYAYGLQKHFTTYKFAQSCYHLKLKYHVKRQTN